MLLGAVVYWSQMSLAQWSWHFEFEWYGKKATGSRMFDLINEALKPLPEELIVTIVGF